VLTVEASTSGCSGVVLESLVIVFESEGLALALAYVAGSSVVA
jgi:hypothetical protein